MFFIYLFIILFKALRNILVKLYISSMETFAKCDYIQHLINLTFNGFNRRATQMRLIANCSALYDFFGVQKMFRIAKLT